MSELTDLMLMLFEYTNSKEIYYSALARECDNFRTKNSAKK